MSGSRWVITPSLLSGSWRSFLYSSSVHSCHLFLIRSASVRSIPFLSLIVPIFAWKVPLVSNFLEEISRLSYSIVFLYFFALISEEGFLISPCYSLELCIQMGISFLFSLPFTSLFIAFLRPSICWIQGVYPSSIKIVYLLQLTFLLSIQIFSDASILSPYFLGLFCLIYLSYLVFALFFFLMFLIFFLSYPWPMKSTLFLIACIKQWSTLELGSLMALSVSKSII